MLRHELIQAITDAILKAQDEGALPAFEVPSIPLEHPRRRFSGDYASPVCMQLARVAHMGPMEIAEGVVQHLPSLECLGQAEVARPGFINFTLDHGWLAQQVGEILRAGETFGNVDLGQGRRMQVEYISGNPTGPLHIGHGRNAVIGDAIANVLEAAGYDVQREYYINDAGSRMLAFYETLYARYAQELGCDEAVPEEGYAGFYMVELAREILATEGSRFLDMPREQAVSELGRIGLERVLASIRSDAAMLGIHYDRWFSEQSLYDDGTFDKAMALLREKGYVEEREGAVWFRATLLGGSKDEVIIRSDGTPGYFASDIAYHYDKFLTRGFEWVIDVWGADHQGHVPRMKALMRALDLDPEQLTIILYQLVTLKRGGEVIRLSKRTGEMITLQEVLSDVGADAVHFFLLSRAADSQMDFDLELAREQSDENPVYYVQYAHARIASILSYAGDTNYSEANLSSLREEPEMALIRKLLEFPEVVEMAASTLAPHHLGYYAQDLAGIFHSFYKQCRVVSSEPEHAERNKARLALVSAAKIVLHRVLTMMGMNAPEKM